MKLLAAFLLSVLLLLGVSAVQAQQQLQPVIVDVRTESEWQAGHLDGAVLIPLERVGQEIARVAPDKRTRVYVYCRTGRRSSLALETLNKAGYADVINLGPMEKAAQELQREVVK